MGKLNASLTLLEWARVYGVRICNSKIDATPYTILETKNIKDIREGNIIVGKFKTYDKSKDVYNEAKDVVYVGVRKGDNKETYIVMVNDLVGDLMQTIWG